MRGSGVNISKTSTGKRSKVHLSNPRPVAKGVRSQSFGDLLCHVVVETPVNLTARQKALLQELEQINERDSGRHNPRAKSWMDKVREFFEA